jgi:hypothetical protein
MDLGGFAGYRLHLFAAAPHLTKPFLSFSSLTSHLSLLTSHFSPLTSHLS